MASRSSYPHSVIPASLPTAVGGSNPFVHVASKNTMLVSTPLPIHRFPYQWPASHRALRKSVPATCALLGGTAIVVAALMLALPLLHPRPTETSLTFALVQQPQATPPKTTTALAKAHQEGTAKTPPPKDAPVVSKVNAVAPQLQQTPSPITPPEAPQPVAETPPPKPTIAVATTHRTPPEPMAVEPSQDSRPKPLEGLLPPQPQPRNDVGNGPTENPNLLAQAFGPFMDDFKARMHQAWRPPRTTNSQRVVVQLIIARDGALKDVWVVQSSGHKDTDEAALNAVRLSGPYLPFPTDIQRDTVDIRFAFDYNILGSRRKASL